MPIEMNSTWVKYLPDFMRTRVAGRQNLQKLITNTGWLFADGILRIGIGLVLSIWIARYLGPDAYGLFSFAGSVVALFSIFATLGLDGVVVRELVRDPSRKTEILGSAFMLKLVGAGFSLVAAVTAILILRPAEPLVHWLVLIIAAGTLFQSFDVIDFWFQARVESRFTVYVRGSAFLLISAVKVILILVKAPLIAFACAGALELLLGALGLLLAYRLTGQHMLAWKAHIQRIRQTMKVSWPLALSAVAVMIYMKIDQVMLMQMLGKHAVGVYSAAVRISEVWYFIPVAIVASVTPALIEAKKASPALYQYRLANLFRLMSAISLGIAIPMTFASGTVARLLYGRQYDGVGPILAIHIWAALFVFLGVAQNPWNINEELTSLALLRMVIGAAVNIILNVVLIPLYGPAGAAIATTVSYALSAVVLNAFNRKTREIFKLQLSSMLMIRPGMR
jgi:O-antigen/teichoic acid export membrane protein